MDPALPDAFMEVFKEGVGVVDLVADGAEVIADGAAVFAAGDGVLQEPGGVGTVGVAGRAGVVLELLLQGRGNSSGSGKVDQAPQELGFLL